jgi:hypothetical protein
MDRSVSQHLTSVPNEVTERKLYGEIMSKLVQISTARCARVSYMTHDLRTPKIEEDVALFERLSGSDPKHLSPLEHQAYPDWHNDKRNLWGNFTGWIQHRKMMERDYE